MRLAPCLGLALVAACSDTSSTPPDAMQDAMPDAYDTARCLIKGDYGALGSLTGTAGSNQGSTTATFTLEQGPPRDTFFIKLTPGNGVFAGGLAPGTYTIEGVDAGYSTCGLCVHIIADINPGSGPSKFFFANAGSVTLTTTTRPITGSATNVRLAEVDISSGMFVPNGCTASIGSVSFTAN